VTAFVSIIAYIYGQRAQKKNQEKTSEKIGRLSNVLKKASSEIEELEDEVKKKSQKLQELNEHSKQLETFNVFKRRTS
jgi:methyl-accepting chemotaxis protein